MNEGFIGEIRLFAGNFAPRNWEYCHGQLLQISSNSALYSILGTTYGGDGRTTFALPDLRGRMPLGPGEGPGLSDRRLGQKGGTESNTVVLNQLPVHSQSASAGAPGTVSRLRAARTTATLSSATGSLTTGSESAIIPQPVNNMQPWLGLHYIICTQGYFPSRG